MPLSCLVKLSRLDRSLTGGTNAVPLLEVELGFEISAGVTVNPIYVHTCTFQFSCFCESSSVAGKVGERDLEMEIDEQC